MIIANSIGFSATHTITSILEEVPNAYVSHGSKNYETRAPLGPDNTSEAEFMAAMQVKNREGATCFALHPVFNPESAYESARAAGIDYKVVVREPRKQIYSCYAWAMKKILDGDATGYLKSLEAVQNLLIPAKIKLTLQNSVYAFATTHVLGFNISALASGCEIIQMESILESEAEFKSAFNIDPDIKLSHFSGEQTRLASHRKSIDDVVSGRPEVDAIIRSLAIRCQNENLTWDQYVDKLGYPAQ